MLAVVVAVVNRDFHTVLEFHTALVVVEVHTDWVEKVHHRGMALAVVDKAVVVVAAAADITW